MDLKVYYQKLRQVEAELTQPHVVVVSCETPDGGRAGVLSEVPRTIAAKMIVEAKARAAFERLAGPVLVEDSGLAVHAWGGFPGALVKWMEKTVGLEGIARMLDPFASREATAVCAVASFDGRDLVVGRGEAHGAIARAPRGSGGFGWDRLFVPEGESRTFAEMAPEEKDRLSHRRRAWEALAARLPGLR
jgi:XTP/dITP diphosphohydrolase